MAASKRSHDQSAEHHAPRRSSRRVITATPVQPSGAASDVDRPSKKTKTAPSKPNVAATQKSNHTVGTQPKNKPKKATSAPTPVPPSATTRESSPDPSVHDIPTTNPEAPPHAGEWYWLMKAEPETRLENGIDVRFSIDDLRAKTEPEGWDGIRAYAARNHMRNMNAGDKAFFYHSNCKEPGIAGVMEIVKEFSEDRTARKPGTPYYDPSSTKEKPRWSLVHVEFRKKFAVPITLKELREMGAGDGPLKDMQMLKQSRLSVSRVGKEEWEHLIKVADEKAAAAGLKHQE